MCVKKEYFALEHLEHIIRAPENDVSHDFSTAPTFFVFNWRTPVVKFFFETKQ
jgi:hypothetical protein